MSFLFNPILLPRSVLFRLSRFYEFQWNMEWMADQESEGLDKDTDKSNCAIEDESISSAGPMPLETAVRQNL